MPLKAKKNVPKDNVAFLSRGSPTHEKKNQFGKTMSKGLNSRAHQESNTISTRDACIERFDTCFSACKTEEIDLMCKTQDITWPLKRAGKQ